MNKKYIKESLLFLLPIILIIIFPIIVLYFSGEFMKLDKIQDKIIKKEQVLLGKVYIVDDDRDVKIPMIKKITPNVMTLGNSRVLQFRQEFFTDDTRFYNGGSLVNNFLDLKKVLESLPKVNKPKVAIVGLDFHLFHPQGDFSYQNINNFDKNKNALRGMLISGFRNVYRDLFLMKYSLSDLFRSRYDDGIFKVGLKARANNDGFRNDGSYLYGKFISDPNNPKNEDYHFKDILRRIERGTQSFYKGQEISDLPVEALREFLQYAKENNIHVIGFHPPYAPIVFDELQKRKDEYAYMSKVYPTIKPIFDQFDQSLFDFSDIRNLGSSDKEFVDGFHGGEKAYLRLFIKMAEEDSILRQFVDIESLKEKLKNTKSDFEIFGN